MKKFKNLVAIFLIALTLFILPSCDSSLAEPTYTEVGVVLTTLACMMAIETGYNTNGYYTGFTYSWSGTSGTETFNNCEVTYDSYSYIIDGKLDCKTSNGDIILTFDGTLTLQNLITYDVYFVFSSKKGFTTVKVDGVSYNPDSFNNYLSSVLSSSEASSYKLNETKGLILTSGLGEITFL